MDSPTTFVRFPGKPSDTKRLYMIANSKKISVSSFLSLFGFVKVPPPFLLTVIAKHGANSAGKTESVLSRDRISCYLKGSSVEQA